MLLYPVISVALVKNLITPSKKKKNAYLSNSWYLKIFYRMRKWLSKRYHLMEIWLSKSLTGWEFGSQNHHLFMTSAFFWLFCPPPPKGQWNFLEPLTEHSIRELFEMVFNWSEGRGEDAILIEKNSDSGGYREETGFWQKMNFEFRMIYYGYSLEEPQFLLNLG